MAYQPAPQISVGDPADVNHRAEKLGYLQEVKTAGIGGLASGAIGRRSPGALGDLPALQHTLGGCPNCGYCPHCGRSNPTYQPYQYPQITYASGGLTQVGTATCIN